MLLVNNRFARLMASEIKPEHFLDQQNRISAEHIISYLTKYRHCPDFKVIVRDYIARDKRVPKAEWRDYAVKLQAHALRVVVDQDYVRDRLIEWTRNQAWLALVMQAPTFIDNGRIAELERRAKQVMTIGEQGAANDEIDYWATATDRRKRREAIASGSIVRGVSTGFAEIDKHLAKKGWGRGELSLILAPTKRGKTAMMLQSGLLASASCGVKVLFVSLEVDDEVATDRMDAALTGYAIDDLMGNAADVEAAVNAMAAAPGRGQFWFVQRPTNTLTPAGLEAILDRMADEGKVPDVVYVDYLGIMKTRPEHRYEDLGHSAKELRRIGGERDIAMVSGYQTNRDGLAKQVSTAADMGDSFLPAQDCDLMLSLNADEAELRMGVRRIHWALVRNGPAVTVKVQSDLSRGRLIDSVIGVTL